MSMKNPLAVVVLDGKILYPDGFPESENILQDTFRHAMSLMPDLLKRHHRILVFHTNFPQIEDFPQFNTVVDLPLEILDCNGEGAIGCMLQGFLLDALRRKGMSRPVISLIPEVEVAAQDQALLHPDRSHGELYGAEEAEVLERHKGWTFRQEEPGRYRRLVAAPLPAAIGDLDIIRVLLENNAVVIAGAGDRLPRICQVQGQSRQQEVFVDGNRLGALLSASLEADMLMLATGQGVLTLLENGREKSEENRQVAPFEPEFLERFLEKWQKDPAAAFAASIDFKEPNGDPDERSGRTLEHQSTGCA